MDPSKPWVSEVFSLDGVSSLKKTGIQTISLGTSTNSELCWSVWDTVDNDILGGARLNRDGIIAIRLELIL
jgi:hypothetical protein